MIRVIGPPAISAVQRPGDTGRRLIPPGPPPVPAGDTKAADGIGRTPFDNIYHWNKWLFSGLAGIRFAFE